MSDVLSTLLSVVVGFGLGAGWDWWRYNQREKQQQSSVRMLVRLEMAQNLQALDQFWKHVIAEPEDATSVGNYQEEIDFINRQRLAQLPFTPRIRLMWESQAGFLAAAFHPDKLEYAIRVNRRLDAFASAREALRDVVGLEENRATLRLFSHWRDEKAKYAELNNPKSMGQVFPDLIDQIKAFNQRTLAQWTACENAYDDVMSQPNLLD